LKLPNYLSDNARNMLISLLNRNPYKRLGAGKRGADEIKEHPYLSTINWEDAMKRKLQVPKPYVKKVLAQDIPLEKVYGRGAFDDNMKNHNRLNEWSYVVIKGPNGQPMMGGGTGAGTQL
jgi:hypothetical protein